MIKISQGSEMFPNRQSYCTAQFAENSGYAEPWLLNECLDSDIDLWQFRRAIGKSVDGET
jgi:hypothetical protein